MSLLPASEEFLLDFPSPRHLSSSGSYPLDLSGLGDLTGSYATAGLALRVTGTHKPLYHGKVEISTKGPSSIRSIYTLTAIGPVVLHLIIIILYHASHLYEAYFWTRPNQSSELIILRVHKAQLIPV
jgi:hypothetical protein